MDPTFNTGSFSWVGWWVPSIMGVPAGAMPGSPTLQWAYDTALNLALNELACVPSQPTSPSVYADAVYNLGGHTLVGIAQDTAPSTFWADLKKQLNFNGFVPGLITSSSDQGTSSSLTIPDQLKGMTLFDLQLAKTPWGSRYIELAGEWGAIWGVS